MFWQQIMKKYHMWTINPQFTLNLISVWTNGSRGVFLQTANEKINRNRLSFPPVNEPDSISPLIKQIALINEMYQI